MARPLAKTAKRGGWLALGAVLTLLTGAPVTAQSSSEPPIDSDLVKPQPSPVPSPNYPPATGASYGTPASPYPTSPYPAPPTPTAPSDGSAAPGYMTQTPPAAGRTYGQPPANGQPSYYSQATSAGCVAARSPDGTYRQDDLIGAATGVFGTGAKGLADIIQSIFRKQGRPDGYIVGREAGGAFVAGLRYGSGTLCSQVAGTAPVYWTGPSIGFDAGASAAKTFVLVYNLYRGDQIFHRYGAGEGQAYLIGGFHVSYLRRGDVVLIPVRMGVGLRLGVNGGYMKFSRQQNWFPF